MNKIYKVLLFGATLLATHLMGEAQIIRMTTIAQVGSSMSFNLAAAEDNTKASIDWGDGNFQEYTIGQAFTEPRGEIKGENIVIKGDVRRFNCTASKLKSLDVSECPKLEVLMAGFNYLTEQISFAKNTELLNLELFQNNLKGIDISNCTKLQRLVISANFLSEVEVTQCPDLDYLDCARMSKITRLDLSKNSKLKSLTITDCAISDLKLPASAPLTEMLLAGNKLTKLDLSAFNKLSNLDCSKNSQLETLTLNAPELTQLLVMETKVTDINLANSPLLEYLMLTGSNQLQKVTYPSNPNIKDLGLSKCNFSQLDLSMMSKLEQLWCNENPNLVSLDVSGCPSLKSLAAKKGALTSIKLPRGGNKLESLHLANNLLTQIDLTGLSALKVLDLGSNQLKALKTTDCVSLEQLNLNTNDIHSLSLTFNKKLNKLGIVGNKMTSQELNAVYEELPQLAKKPGTVNLYNGAKNDFAAQCSNTDLAEGRNWNPQIKGDASGKDIDAIDGIERSACYFAITPDAITLCGMELNGLVQYFALDGSLIYSAQVKGNNPQLVMPTKGSYLAVYTDQRSGEKVLTKLYISK